MINNLKIFGRAFFKKLVRVSGVKPLTSYFTFYIGGHYEKI